MSDLPVDTAMAHEIAKAIQHRQATFTNEDFVFSVLVVLLNWGDRYASVRCLGPEAWEGTKHELLPGSGMIPKCPNGHVMMQSSPWELRVVSGGSNE